MAERRRSAIPQPASGLPKRAPSPSSAAFSSTRSTNGGPLGAYRPPSREGSERPASRLGGSVASTSAAAPSATARFGFGSASSSNLAAGGVGAVKRTLSSAGLRDPETPGKDK
jgi:hypothetical protein